ncbi:tetratricopeptide repeat protein [Enterobacter sp. 22325]|uniref:tetratricopeptide repeat protein n=1 Tax=Enterobacter sp. 22325 TaxID=3453911 RepID=UPI003F87BB75
MKKITLFTVLLLCGCNLPYHPKNILKTSELAIEVGALDKALELAKIKAQNNPDSAEARFHLADIYHRLKRYDMENNELNALKSMTSLNTKDKNRLYNSLMKNSLLRDDYDTTIELYNESEETQQSVPLKVQGERELYYAVAYCKKWKFDICFDYLNKASQLLPGDERVAQNIQLASWMNNSKNDNSANNTGLLFKAYQENNTAVMFSNLVLSLVKEGDYSRAFEVLSTRYSSEDANIIITDLKKMRI